MITMIIILIKIQTYGSLFDDIIEAKFTLTYTEHEQYFKIKRKKNVHKMLLQYKTIICHSMQRYHCLFLRPTAIKVLILVCW